MQIRRSETRGHADHGWLRSQHTFSFARFMDPNHMGHSDLRVINEDRVAPGRGFGQHPHRDMEIISYVLDGGLEHRDSMGTGSVIQRDDVQLMSAGTGVTHSEFNHSKEEGVHFLQIWILPSERGAAPRYAQTRFERRPGELQLLVSEDGREGSLKIRQDAALYRAILSPGQSLERALATDRRGWLHVVSGDLTVNGEPLKAGDGVALNPDDTALQLVAGGQEAEVLLFDLR